MGAMKDLAIQLDEATVPRRVKRAPYQPGDLVNVAYNCDLGDVRGTVPVLDVARNQDGTWSVACWRMNTALEYQQVMRFNVDKRGRMLTRNPYTGEISPIFKMSR